MTVKGPPSSPGASASFSSVTGAYTLTADDLNTTLQVNSGSSVAITLPNDLPAGWRCEIEHLGAGAVTFAAASGATLTSIGSAVKTAGAGSACRLRVRSNSNGVSASWVLFGDTDPLKRLAAITLPTSDPASAGAWYTATGAVKVSAG